MGTHMRVVVGAPVRDGLPSSDDGRRRGRRLPRGLQRAALALSPGLRAEPAERRPARDRPGLGSAARRRARRALGGARTGGLVDPTVLDDLETVGYVESWNPERRLDLRDALAGDRPAPGRRTPPREQRWQLVTVDDDAGTITRPAGPAPRHRRHRQGPRGRARERAARGLRRLGRRLRRRPAHRRRRRPRPRRRGRAPLQRRDARDDQDPRRRRRDVRPALAHLARRGRRRPPPPARSVDRPARVHRARRRHGARAQRRRGRGARQAGAAERPARRPHRPRRARRDHGRRGRRRRPHRPPRARAARALPPSQPHEPAPEERRMTGPDPLHYGWWLASRSAGIVSILAVSVSVIIGLLMANGLPKQGLGRPHQEQARRGPRVDRAGRHGRDQRPRPDAPGRQVHAPDAVADRRAVHDGLPARLHRPRHHRRLARGLPRACPSTPAAASA